MSFIFVTVLLDMVSFGMVLPVLQLLILQMEGGDAAKAAGIAGLFGTAWAAMQFICSPIQGALSDQYGRRPVLLISMAGLGIDKIVMALAPTVPLLFVGRVVSGITAASFSTAAAYVADITEPNERARNFGYLSGAFSAGFILGPAIGGVLGSADFARWIGVTPEEALRIPFWVAAFLCLLNALWGFFVLPESLPPERRSRFDWRRANPVGALSLLRSHPILLGLGGVAFLAQLSYNALPSIFTLYAHVRYGWDSAAVGWCLGLVGALGIIVSVFTVQPFVKRFGERTAILTGLACMATALAIYGFAPTGALFLLGVPFGAVMGLYGPSAQSLMTQRIDPTRQGQLQGALASIMGLTGTIGPSVFTNALAWGIDAQGPHIPGLPLFIAAGICATALMAAVWVTSSIGRAAPKSA